MHKWILPLLWVLFLGASAHQFYVSMMQVDYNPHTQSLEISCKIFTDDLDLALQKQGGTTYYLGTDREKAQTAEALEQYLKSSIFMEVNDKPVNWVYVGKEQSADATWIYMEVKGVKTPQTIKLTNRLLTEIYEAQTNIVHFSVGKTKRSLMFSKTKTTDKVSF
ncbi:MAG TPA: hypothetical protein PK239_11370 [Chitinophagales bacterium]|nr:hypothetical protein [Chitinophagales bacterium]HRK27868.1 hypothetical protein [Chitinophagales bacterium]